MLGLDKKFKAIMFKFADNLEAKSVEYVTHARKQDGVGKANLMTRAGILNDLASIIRQTLDEGKGNDVEST